MMVFLPLCLALRDQRRPSGSTDSAPRHSGDPKMAVAPPPLVGLDLLSLHCQWSLYSNSQAPFPATLAWASLQHVGDQGFEHLFQKEPWEFLQMCLDRYDREVKGYSTLFVKRERMDGKLKDEEVVECHFKEKPFSVYMNWIKGWGKAKKAVYVKGENNDRMLALPAPPLGFFVVSKEVDCEDARKSGRYLINQFGMKLGTERTLSNILKARERGKLTLQYLGVNEVEELGFRPCYTFLRSKYDPPEEEGVYELLFYIDVETWLQSGSVLKDTKGELIAEYYFRDIKLNPQFGPNQFTRKAM
jgi:hypothetical protein